MGVEYKHYLIPRPNWLQASAGQFLTLLDALRVDGWLCHPCADSFSKMTFDTRTTYNNARQSGAFVKTATGSRPFPQPVTKGWLEDQVHRDMVMCWPVENLAEAGLRYPLCPREMEAQDTYYEMQIWLASDYVYEMSGCIDPFPEEVLHCKCGVLLEAWPADNDQNCYVGYSAHIKYQCPNCGRAFDTTSLAASVRDPWSGESAMLPGGVTYRFAIVVDCGKCFARSGGKIEMEPAFVSLLQEVLTCPFYQFGDVY